MAFIDLMKEKARQNRKTIVLPESEDQRTLTAAAQILKEGTADLILVGNAETIKKDAAALNADIEGVKIVDPETDPKFEHYAGTLFKLREKKGMTLEKATATLKSDLITYGVMMVKEGDADGLVAGACHATADTLRPALQILKTAPGTELVSGFFIMDVPNCEYGANGTFLFADCGLNQDPTSEELAAIANSSSDSFRALTGEEPKIAMLSHSTKGSAKHALVDKVTAAVSIAHEKYPELNLDGELQLDACLLTTQAHNRASGFFLRTVLPRFFRVRIMAGRTGPTSVGPGSAFAGTANLVRLATHSFAALDGEFSKLTHVEATPWQTASNSAPALSVVTSRLKSTADFSAQHTSHKSCISTCCMSARTHYQTVTALPSSAISPKIWQNCKASSTSTDKPHPEAIPHPCAGGFRTSVTGGSHEER